MKKMYQNKNSSYLSIHKPFYFTQEYFFSYSRNIQRIIGQIFQHIFTENLIDFIIGTL